MILQQPQLLFGHSTTDSVQPFGFQSVSIFGATNTSGNTFGQLAAFGSQTTPFGGAQPTAASTALLEQQLAKAHQYLDQVQLPPALLEIFLAALLRLRAVDLVPVILLLVINVPTLSIFLIIGFGTTPTTNAFGSPAATQSSSGSFGFGGLSVGATSSSDSIFGGTSGKMKKKIVHSE